MSEPTLCYGKRLNDGLLLGLCIGCDRRITAPDEQRRAYIEHPPAVRGEDRVWSCDLHLQAVAA